LPQRKLSHVRLAAQFKDPGLVTPTPPTPADFPAARITALATAWAEFNADYHGIAGGKFDKYAKRLGQDLLRDQAQPPKRLLAPYFVASNTHDPWWTLSKQLFDATPPHAGVAIIKTVATDEASHLDALLAASESVQAIIWVSDLNELESSAADLRAYRTAIQNATARGTAVFGLYGGFYSVLCASAGLAGISHGVGFVESRAWVELPASGPPPARYYLPRVHRYAPVALAEALHRGSPQLTACACPDCSGASPFAMDKPALLRHAVRCRSDEIKIWASLDAAEAREKLSDECEAFDAEVGTANLVPQVRKTATRLTDPSRTWIAALT
jgi:hypothetical protein